MSTKVALIIIYNHRFDKNIEIIEKIYKNKFTDIYHLMPFYTGKKKNVIPVYENSIYFQGYVAQGLKHYYKDKYEHYFFIADDLLLNPKITEHNYKKFLKLNNNTCFTTNIDSLNIEPSWPHLAGLHSYEINLAGLEINNEFPSYEEAKEKIQNHNIQFDPLFTMAKHVYNKPLSKMSIKEIFVYFARKMLNITWEILNYLKFLKKWIKFILKLLLKEKFNAFLKSLKKKRQQKFTMPYPLVKGYSDIFVISKKNIKQFAHLCGMFAATNLFVEIALPTALLFSSNTQISTIGTTSFKGDTLWTQEERAVIKNQYNLSLKSLLNANIFWEKKLFIHPVKLSQWDTKL